MYQILNNPDSIYKKVLIFGPYFWGPQGPGLGGVPDHDFLCGS